MHLISQTLCSIHEIIYSYTINLAATEWDIAPGMKMVVFWVVAPCSLVEVYRRFKGACCLYIRAMSTSETSVNIYQTTRCNNPEDSHLHTRRSKNLKSYIAPGRLWNCHVPKYHATKACRGRGGKAPLGLEFGIGWRWVKVSRSGSCILMGGAASIHWRGPIVGLNVSAKTKRN
jgi:hypothetical protein